MLLISPAEGYFGGIFARYMPVSVPVAVGMLAGYARQEGIDARVFDEEVEDLTPEKLHELVKGLDGPILFGISCMTAHVTRAYEISKMIKQEFDDALGHKVVLGGIHVTALPDEPLKTGHIDYVVRGEGEQALLELHTAVKLGNDVGDIPGVSYIREGEIVHNPQGSLLPDLGVIPVFPHELFTHPRYDHGFMLTSRGCPYNCTYCSQRMMTGTTYRYRPVERLIEEIDLIVEKYGQKVINFYDDNFCVKKSRVKEICDAIIAGGYHKKCKFMLQTRADNFPEEMVPLLAEAGFTMVGFGMETGVDRVAAQIQKEETVQQHLDAIELANKYGMQCMVFMITGFPTETREERWASFRLARSLKAHAPKFNNLIPYPGTPIYTDLKESDRVHFGKNWYNFNSTLSGTTSIFGRTPLAYVPETVSEFELKRDILLFNMLTNLTWRNLRNIITRKGELSWVQLPKHWYVKPKELYNVSVIAFHALVNMFVILLPLAITEPIMNALNPAMRARPRIKDFNTEGYKPTHWDKKDTRHMTELLSLARRRQKAESASAPLSIPPEAPLASGEGSRAD